jgi:hypothetical protein
MRAARLKCCSTNQPAGTLYQGNVHYLAGILRREAGLLGARLLVNLLAERKRVSAPVEQPSERRDVELAIQHWERNTWGQDCVPLLETFDFSPMQADWGHRFLICGDPAIERSVFVTYGAGFARLLGLPSKPATTTPFIRQIPEPHREMFSEGYSKALMESSPVTLEGTLRLGAGAQLFRAVFMPIMLRPNWSKQLIFGSFNCRPAKAIER